MADLSVYCGLLGAAFGAAAILLMQAAAKAGRYVAPAATASLAWRLPGTNNSSAGIARLMPTRYRQQQRQFTC